MFPCAGFVYGFWWIFPIIMLVMMALCFFMMRGRMGAMMCRPSLRGTGGHGGGASDAATDVLDRRHAQEEISKGEYEININKKAK